MTIYVVNVYSKAAVSHKAQRYLLYYQPLQHQTRHLVVYVTNVYKEQRHHLDYQLINIALPTTTWQSK